MKKFFMLVALVFTVTFLSAQSNDEFTDMINKKDFVKAKISIDTYLADAKNAGKADAWYFKGKIYNGYSNEKTAPESEVYNFKSTAFDAFKKNQQLDPKDIWLKLEGYISYLDLYLNLYDLGATYFNAKNYEGAYNSFKKALEVEDYILSKKYTFTQATLHPLDTSLVLNIAIAATQAKKPDEGIIYYKKLTDAGVSGDQYKEVYEYMVDYYNKKEDPAMNTFLAKGKQLYPSDNYWNEIELASISKKGDQPGLFTKYEEMIANDPKNFALAYNYAVELYNNIYGKNAKQSEDMAAKDKLSAVLKGAIANDPGIDAVVLMSNHAYNMAADYDAAITLIKGAKPEDVKKKNDLKALANKKMDECILYSEQGIKYFDGKASELTAGQKANYKKLLDYMSEIYGRKGNKVKSAEYDKKRTSIN